MSKVTKRFTEAMRAAIKQTTTGYDTTAEVKRIEGGTAWVHIPGGVDETPVKLTINAKPGDTVQGRVAGGSAWLVGNASAPPTDDRKAIEAREAADRAAIQAHRAAQEAFYAQQASDQNAIGMANAVVAINADIADLQSQIDGNITSWFYTVDPAMNLPPVTVDPDNPGSTGWDTDAKKADHVGDLYYNTVSGYVWRFVYQNSAYQWVRVQDSDVTQALADAAEAKDLADHKRRVFITTPTPPYDEGDLWCEGGSGDILTCTTAKVEGQVYASTDWTKLNKYTDDSRANAAYNLANSANTTAGNALTSANGKNKIYHQASAPTGGTYVVGDTWFDTDDGYKMYRWSGSAWVAEQFGNAAIVDLAITNAKIANGTIQNAKISTLDAGKITTGTLDAARIATGSLSVSQISGLSTELSNKVTSGANISVLANDGTYATGRMRSITLSSEKSYTYSAAAGFVGLSSDSWSGISSIGEGTWNKGDMVAIPCTITDRNNAAAFFLCRIVSYSGTTLVADNLALELDSDASKYVTEISGYNGVCVHDAEDASNFANLNSNGMTVYKDGSQKASFGDVVKLITVGTGAGRGTRVAQLDGDGLYLMDGSNVQIGGLGVVNKSSGYPDSCYIDFGHGAAIYIERTTGHQPSEATTDEGAIDFYTNNQRAATIHTDGTLNCKKISAENLQSGSVTFSQTSSGSYSDKTISFSPSYSAAPNVVAGFQLGTGSTAANFGNCSVAVVSVSTTGATLRFYNNSGGNKTPTVNWIALG